MFKLTPSLKKQLVDALNKCDGQVDLTGWRYDQYTGMAEYNPINTSDSSVQYQFHICIKFLKTFFPRSYHTETVFSEDLKSGAEKWWAASNEEVVWINNGIMILALISKGLAPEDLWFAQEPNQQALIPPTKWKQFCDEFDYSEKTDWLEVNKIDKNLDTIKIN